MLPHSLRNLIRVAAVGATVALAVSVGVGSLPAQAVLAGAYQYPVDWSAGKVTFPFGSYAGSSGYHLADDAIADPGTPVYATATGTVSFTANWPDCGNYGGVVLVQHDNPDGTQVVSLYGHLDGSRLAVQKDQVIQRGTLLGYIGTDQQNGCWVPHVHFGISKGPYQTQWKYYGYGPQSMLADWENPTPYVAAHAKVVEIKRVPGASPDRYATAVGVSAARYPAVQSANQVLLASGENFVDALAATPLVQLFNASLLLTKHASLPASTQAEIQRILPPGKMVTVLGGAKAVSDNVLQQVAALGYAVQRIDGSNRAATAVGVANLTPATPARTFVVNDTSFADAVSVGATAGGTAWPVLLTKQGTLSPETRRFFEQHPGATRATIVGGETAVSAAVEAELRTIPTINDVERLGGPDRYSTNVTVNQYLVGAPESVVVATGTNFADALTGGALAAQTRGTLVLTKQKSLPGVESGYMSPVRATVTSGFVLGGATAVDPSIDTTLAKLLNEPLAGAPSTASVEPVAPPASGPAAPISAESWNAASIVTVDGLNVPVPNGFKPDSATYRGATVVSVVDQDPFAGDVPAALSVVSVPVHAGSTAREAVAQWLGIDASSVVSNDLGVRPGIVPTYVRYVDRGSHVVIIEARTSSETLSAHAASLN
ncbi:MAG: cell wall-binding repeat-containing protein [Candidatus Andersenbacteria bacterium]